jgi:hypothetical protein
MVVHEVAGIEGEAALEVEEEALRVLLTPLAVRLVALDGVHVRAEPLEATIVRLSRQRAAIHVPGGAPEVAQLGTVRLTFDGVEASDVYAKVVDSANEVLVHFTSIAPAASATMAKLLDG